MTITRQQRNYETNEAPPQLSGLSQKMLALKTCQEIFGKELTEDEGRQWREFIDQTPGWLVAKAFKEWTRTKKFFPKPADILELIDAHKGRNRIPFQACEKDGCMDGWILTEMPSDLYKSGIKRVAVRCQCWQEWSGQ